MNPRIIIRLYTSKDSIEPDLYVSESSDDGSFKWTQIITYAKMFATRQEAQKVLDKALEMSYTEARIVEF